MPRFRRLVVPGYPHHITQRGVRRQTTFFEPTDYKAYLDLAVELLGDSAIDVYSYCLMPNHIHAIVVPHDDRILSRFFAALHQRYARRTNAIHEWRGHLWQERFYSVVMNEAHTIAAMRYAELNPVRAGLVRLPHAWPWSSARGNLGLVDDPIVDRRLSGQLVSNWRDYLGEDIDDNELESLRRQTRTGRPEGDDKFINQLEAKSGRLLHKKKRGRKPK